MRAILRRTARSGTSLMDDSYAILAQLESSFTAFDHTNDLNDEVFRNPLQKTREEKLTWLAQFAKSA